MVVWKYELPMEDVATVAMPRGARLLYVAEQDATPCVWALVDPAVEVVPRKLRVAGTGHDLGPGVGELCAHVGSLMLYDDSLVFHVFDLGEAEVVAERTGESVRSRADASVTGGVPV